MDVVRGTVVRSTAGRDKGGYFTVLETDGLYAVICDGKRRSLEHAKRKKIKHLAPTLMVLSEQSMETNRAIRKALSAFTK